MPKTPSSFTGSEWIVNSSWGKLLIEKGSKFMSSILELTISIFLLSFLQLWVLARLFSCLKDTVPLNFSKNILGWETISEKDISGVLENSLEVLETQLPKLSSTISFLLNLGFVSFNIFLVIDTSRFSAGSFHFTTSSQLIHLFFLCDLLKLLLGNES